MDVPWYFLPIGCIDHQGSATTVDYSYFTKANISFSYASETIVKKYLIHARFSRVFPKASLGTPPLSAATHARSYGKVACVILWNIRSFRMTGSRFATFPGSAVSPALHLHKGGIPPCTEVD
jgi:hypothetical protein